MRRTYEELERDVARLEQALSAERGAALVLKWGYGGFACLGFLGTAWHDLAVTGAKHGRWVTAVGQVALDAGICALWPVVWLVRAMNGQP